MKADRNEAFEDDFSSSHPTFQWLFRATNNWNTIARWIPVMRRHLLYVKTMVSNPNHVADFHGSESNPSTSSGDEEYSQTFRESFCVAAQTLAVQLAEPLNELGILHGNITMTGTLPKATLLVEKSLRKRFSFRSSSKQPDTEARNEADLWGRGQVLFLVRQVNKKKVASLQSLGYRFISVAKISQELAFSMQVPLTSLSQTLDELKAQCFASGRKEPTGTLLGCFALRAQIFKREWEVLVPKFQPHRLPTVPLWASQLDATRMKYLLALDGETADDCLNYVSLRIGCLDEEEDAFCRTFKRALIHLAETISEPFFRAAIFSSKSFQLPINEYTGRKESSNMFIFHIVPDVHASLLQTIDRLDYTPLTFFKCRQEILDCGQNDVGFQNRLHEEFSTLLTKHGEELAKDLPFFCRSSSNTSESAFSAFSKKPTRWLSSRRIPALTNADDRNLNEVSCFGTDILFTADSKEENCVSLQDCGLHDRLSCDGIANQSQIISEKDLMHKKGDYTSTRVSDATVTASGRTTTIASDHPTFVEALFEVATARWQKSKGHGQV